MSTQAGLPEENTQPKVEKNTEAPAEVVDDGAGQEETDPLIKQDGENALENEEGVGLTTGKNDGETQAEDTKAGATEEKPAKEGESGTEAPAPVETVVETPPVKKFPYENETRIENCRYCTHNNMMRLVSGPQTDSCSELGIWSIYFAIALGIFLTIFFVLLGILYYSVVMVALLGTAVVSYWAYLYYGPHWDKYD